MNGKAWVEAVTDTAALRLQMFQRFLTVFQGLNEVGCEESERLKIGLKRAELIKQDDHGTLPFSLSFSTRRKAAKAR